MDSNASSHHRSFEHLYRMWHPLVRQWAIAVLNDPDDADDVAQDVFRRLLCRGKWREIDSPARYFRSAAFKEALCVQRARRTQAPMDQTEIDKLPFQGPGPDELAARREYRRVVEAQLARLPTQCAKVATLVVLGELSHAEAAGHLGLTVDAVAKQVARSRTHMRRHLRRDKNGDLRRVSTLEDGGAGGASCI